MTYPVDAMPLYLEWLRHGMMRNPMQHEAKFDPKGGGERGFATP